VLYADTSALVKRGGSLARQSPDELPAQPRGLGVQMLEADAIGDGEDLTDTLAQVGGDPQISQLDVVHVRAAHSRRGSDRRARWDWGLPW
jgi:hypothetical protein